MQYEFGNFGIVVIATTFASHRGRHPASRRSLSLSASEEPFFEPPDEREEHEHEHNSAFPFSPPDRGRGIACRAEKQRAFRHKAGFTVCSSLSSKIGGMRCAFPPCVDAL